VTIWLNCASPIFLTNLHVVPLLNLYNVQSGEMLLCILVQFRHHDELRHRLLDTGDARIVFVSSDDFLGSGCDAEQLSASNTYRGKNWLGKTLMKLRLQLKVLVH